MTLLHLFLIHRYRASAVHFLTPTEDNRRQCERMAAIGIFATVNDEVGHIIVADVARDAVRTLAQPDSNERERLITRTP
jgi:isocitrate lyase